MAVVKGLTQLDVTQLRTPTMQGKVEGDSSGIRNEILFFHRSDVDRKMSVAQVLVICRQDSCFELDGHIIGLPLAELHNEPGVISKH